MSRPSDPGPLLALDVGGTHSRAVAARATASGLEPHPALAEPLTRQVGDLPALERFVRDVLARFPEGSPPGPAVLAFAGPVSGDTARITNWSEPREISRSTLTGWGLPEEATSLINDVEAGAHGLVELLERGDGAGDAIQPLRLPDGGVAAGGPAADEGNRVLVIPGTGLGCAGIVRMPGTAGWLPVASEAGHAPAAALDAEHAAVIDRLRDRTTPGSPSWEDFISGRGLTTFYRHLPSGPVPGPGSLLDRSDPADAIAAAATTGGDRRATLALGLYYRCLGRFAQLLALAFGATAGVFVAGGSTRENRDFLVDSGLVQEFLANAAQRRLLETIPLYLVLEELNLRGALAVARRMAAAGGG